MEERIKTHTVILLCLGSLLFIAYSKVSGLFKRHYRPQDLEPSQRKKYLLASSIKDNEPRE